MRIATLMKKDHVVQMIAVGKWHFSPKRMYMTEPRFTRAMGIPLALMTASAQAKKLEGIDFNFGD